MQILTQPCFSSSTAALPTCTAGADPEKDVTVVPMLNPSIDQASLANLIPSNYATLYYEDPAPGTTVVKVDYALNYPQVTLENSNLITVQCSGGTAMTITMANQGAYQNVASWPTSNLVLITNSEDCNPSTQRGVYMVDTAVFNSAGLTATLLVTSKSWSDVAETMEISYGTTSTPTSTTPSCSVPDAAPSSSAGPYNGTVSYASLTPDEKELVALLTQGYTFTPDGGVIIPATGATDQAVDTSDLYFNPSYGSDSDAGDALTGAGLPDPNTMYNATYVVDNGFCSANHTWIPAGTVLPLTRRSFVPWTHSPARSIDWKREEEEEEGEYSDGPFTAETDKSLADEDWWEYIWEVACNSVVKSVVSEISKGTGLAINAICLMKEMGYTLKDAYDSRDAIRCAYQLCYIDVPTTTEWQWSESSNADFTIPPQWLSMNDYGTVNCVDCDLQITSVSYEGTFSYSYSTGALTAAFFTPKVSYSSHLIMSLTSNAPYSGTWDYNFAKVDVPNGISVDGEFSIDTSMIYSLGLQWSTNKAVDFTAGGIINVNEGSFYLDVFAQTASQFENWTPTIEYTYPVFTTEAEITFVPIMRSSIQIGINILGQPYGAQPVYITTAASLGFDAALFEDDGGACPAGQLMVTSYSNVQNNVVFSGQTPQALAPSGNVPGTPRCYDVPNDHPTNAEVSSLKSAGADEFCSSCKFTLDYSFPYIK